MLRCVCCWNVEVFVAPSVKGAAAIRPVFVAPSVKGAAAIRHVLFFAFEASLCSEVIARMQLCEVKLPLKCAL